MTEISSIEEIIKLIQHGKFTLICIDGIDGAGKSTLAENISKSLNLNHINLDEYLEKEKGNFVEFINFDKLKASINESNKPIIIEGICILEVLSKISREPELLIYIKRVSSYGEWRDEEQCVINEDIEHFIERQKQDLIGFCKIEAGIEGHEFNENEFTFSPLREEIFRYHHKHRPHEKADVLFIRNNC